MAGRKTEPSGKGDGLPFFSSWKRLYAAVLLNLALTIALFTLFTEVFK
jgi:hypothetical protein